MKDADFEVDDLFSVKNNYYIGNYVKCVKEAEKIKAKNSDVDLMKKFYVCRAYIAQKKSRIVLEELSKNSIAELEILKLLAKYNSSSDDERAEIVNDLETQLKNRSSSLKRQIDAKIVATIFMKAQQWPKALNVIENCTNIDLELLAFSAFVCLKIDRVDLAKKKLNEMQAIDDDGLLTQLAQAWIFVYSGLDKLREADVIFHELIERYGPTPLLLNGRAAVNISQGSYSSAEDDLSQSFEKDDNNPDTLINSIIVSKYLNKSNEIQNRYWMQLKDEHLNHPFLQDYRKKEADFITECSYYKPSKNIHSLNC